jgi:hypothetical protein
MLVKSGQLKVVGKPCAVIMCPAEVSLAARDPSMPFLGPACHCRNGSCEEDGDGRLSSEGQNGISVRLLGRIDRTTACRDLAPNLPLVACLTCKTDL